MSSLLAGISTGLSGGNRFFSAQDQRELARERFEYEKEQDKIRNEDALVANQLAAERNRIAGDRLTLDSNQFEFEKKKWGEGAEARALANTSVDLANEASMTTLRKDRAQQLLPVFREYEKEDGSLDLDSMIQNDPYALASALLVDESLMIGRDPNGKIVRSREPRAVRLPNGNIGVEVKNEQGVYVPIARDRSGKPDAPIFQLTPDEFPRRVRTILNTYTTYGAENQRTREIMNVFSESPALDASLRRSLVSVTNASGLAERDPEANSVLKNIIFDPDATTEDLVAIAEDNGIDVDALREASATDTASDPEPVDAPQSTTTSSFDLSSVDRNTPTGRLIFAAEGQGVQRGRNGLSPEQARARLERREAKLQSEIEATEANRGRLSPAARKNIEEGGNDALPEKRNDLQQIRAYLGKDNSASPYVADLDSLPPKESPEFRTSLISALENAQPPTEEEQQQVVQTLQQYQVEDPRQMWKLPTKKAYQAIAVLAGREPDATKRVAIIDQLTNVVTTGVSNLSAKDRETLDLRAGEYTNSVLNRLQEGDKINYNRLRDLEGEIDTASAKVTEVIKGLVDPSGRYMAPTAEATAGLQEIFRNYEDLPPGPKKAATQLTAYDALFEFIAAKAATARPGAFEFLNKIDAWKATPGQLRIGKNAAASLIRVADNGATIVMKNPTGGDATFRIPATEFKRFLGPGLYEEVIKFANSVTDAAGR